MAYQTRTQWGLESERDEPWQKRAACAGDDPDRMHPFPAIPPGELWLLREVCFGCPVKVQCLRDGVAAGDWDSIRGGLTGKERYRHYRDGLEPDEFPAPVRPRCAVCSKPTWEPLRLGRCSGCRAAEKRAAKREQVAS